MVKLLQMKMMLLLVMLVGAGSSFAAETADETMTFSERYSSNTTLDDTELNGTNFYVKFNKRSGGTATQYYTNGYAVRWYGGGTMKVASRTKTITKIVVTFTQTANSISTDVGSYSLSNSIGTWTGSASSVTFTQSGTSGQCRISSVAVWYASSDLDDCDLALTNAPIALNFDLYNNFSAQTISYTTSSTGAVSVASSDYATFSVDQTNKTITVTPTTVTPSTQTITVRQAADETHAAGSATFTLTVSDSTPFEGGDVTFTAGTDKGSTTSQDADQVSKSVVTISSTSAALASDEYRFYASSTTTISTTKGNIVKIVFTEADSEYPISRLSAQGYSNGTWTGNAQSVSFTASAQARVSTIVVTVNTKEPVATINGITPTSIDLNDEGSFICDIVYADGVTANDATITWSSDNEDVLVIDETDGSYITGASGGTVNVTVTVTPNDETSYSAVSKHFTVTVVDPNGPGSQGNPYTVAQVINGDADGQTDIWVKGYIVGSWNNNKFDPDNLVETNLALADEYNSTTTIPVELPSGDIRTTWGPASNKNNINVAQVVLKGNGTTYFSKNAVKGTSEIEKIAEMVTITSAEYATRHSNVALDYSEGGIKAYTATDNATSVTLNEIASGQVPASTPVVLYKAEGCIVRVPVIESAPAVGDNDLYISEGEAYENAYVLAKPGDKPVGFYLWDSSVELEAGKVYLQSVTGESGARQFLPFDEATGISETVSVKNDNHVTYDLQGRRVVKAQKGLYIMNGKKVIMK